MCSVTSSSHCSYKFTNLKYYNLLCYLGVARLQTRKRDKLDIMLGILETCRQPIKKTHILYKARINSMQLKSYLNLLTRTEMLEYDRELNSYRITEKGQYILNVFTNPGSEKMPYASWEGQISSNLK